MIKTTSFDRLTAHPPERPFVRFPAPKSYFQHKLDKVVTPLREELWFTRRMLFDDEERGWFAEKLQVSELALLLAEKQLHDERALNAKELEDRVLMKDSELERMGKISAELDAENAQLHETVDRMKAAQEDSLATQTGLATSQTKLMAENVRLHGKLAIVSRAFRKMVDAAKRHRPGHLDAQLGRRMGVGKASRKSSSAPKLIQGVEKKRSKSARKHRI